MKGTAALLCADTISLLMNRRGYDLGFVARWTLTLDASPARLAVEGELDAAAEPDFIAAVDAAFADHELPALVLDLSKVEFLDSSGLRALLTVAKAHGERLRLGPTSNSVRRLLELTQSASAFLIEENG